MHSPFADLGPGTPLPVLRLGISPGANERYWRSAGVEHPALVAGALYPPIAANLTVLCFGQICAEPVIQTRQRLRCHRRALARVELVTTGRVTAACEKRGRRYLDIEAVVTTADAPDERLWTSEVSFTPAATLTTS